MIVLSILTIDMEAVAKRMLVLGAKDPGSTSMTSSCTKAKRLDVVFDVFPTTCPPFFILLPHEVLFLSFVRKILPRVASNERERERVVFPILLALPSIKFSTQLAGVWGRFCMEMNRLLPARARMLLYKVFSACILYSGTGS